MPRLANKVALITGAAGGQGTAEAELFLREGAAVVLSNIDAAAGERLAKRLTEQGGKALFRVQDVASEQGWQEIVQAALSAFGGLHILVNNAGTIARQGIVDTTLEAWNRTVAVNLTGALLGMKYCAPAIRDSGGGAIVNISSTAGLTAHDDAAYTATKWGLRGLTKTAVLQFSPWNIRVNSIHPARSPIPDFSRAAATHSPMRRGRRSRCTGRGRRRNVPRCCSSPQRRRASSAAPRSRSMAAISPPASPICATASAPNTGKSR